MEGIEAMVLHAAAQAGRHSAPEAEAFTAFRLPSLLTKPGLARNSPSHPCGPLSACGGQLCLSSNKARSTHRLERCATRFGCAARHRQWGLAPAGLGRLSIALPRFLRTRPPALCFAGKACMDARQQAYGF